MVPLSGVEFIGSGEGGVRLRGVVDVSAGLTHISHDATTNAKSNSTVIVLKIICVNSCKPLDIDDQVLK